jgi:hypothetical protein
MMRIVKKSGRRKLQQTLRKERFVPPKSAQRRSASTPKHESASLARQQRQASRAVTRRTSPPEERAKVEVEETASRDRVTSNHLHERQHRVDANCSMHHIHRSLGQSMCRGEKKAAAAQGVDRRRRICRRSLSANHGGLREVEARASRAEAHTALRLVLHDEEASTYSSRLVCSTVHSI